MTPKMIKQIEEQVRPKVTKDVVDKLLETLIYVLYNEWGWGYMRIDKLTDQINDLYDSIEKKYVDFNDIKEDNKNIPRPKGEELWITK